MTALVSPAEFCGAVVAADFAKSMSAPPVLSSDSVGWSGGLIRRWRDVSPLIHQPKLRDSYVVLHLGGAKRVQREGEGKRLASDAPHCAISVVPAGSAYRWRTEGPIDFVHSYLSAARIRQCVVEMFDKEPSGVFLNDVLGVENHLLSGLFQKIVEDLESPNRRSNLYLDCLYNALVTAVVEDYSNVRTVAAHRPAAIAPSRLSRVIDFMHANLGADIRLDELAAVAGSSKFHFSRAFRLTTGHPPHAYLTRIRIDQAKVLLSETDLALSDVARKCGIPSYSHFSTVFRIRTGSCPRDYRQNIRRAR